MTVRGDLLAETTAALGLAESQPLQALTLVELGVLRDAAMRARERERAAVASAIDQAMTHVPALLRGAVRRILFP